MPTYANVEHAARLGELAQEARDPGAQGEVTRIMSETFAESCVLLATRQSGEKLSPLSAFGYEGKVVDSLCTLFPVSPWMALVRAGELPPSISTEAGQTFRHGWFYEEHLQPAGLRDGMTAAVIDRGQLVGLVHLSSLHDGQFTVQAQRLFAALLRPLGTMIRANVGHGLYGDEFTITKTGGAPLTDDADTLPGWAQEDDFLALIADLTGRASCRLSTLWFADRQCFRLDIIVNSDQRPVVARVRAQPIDPPYDLTHRELEVLSRVAIGYSTDTIARKLWISPRTVHSHIERILRKTRQPSRLAAASLAIRKSIIVADPHTAAMFITAATYD